MVPKEVLADLPAFVAVAERLSFRAAAEALGLTPAALSKAINRLELRIGEPLLLRTTRRVELTAAGTALRQRAVEALELVSDGMAAAARERLVAGPVRVAAPPPVLALVGERLADLMRRHPGLTLVLSDREAPGADLTLRLAAPRAGAPEAEGWVALGEIPVVSVAAPAHLSAMAGWPGGSAASGDAPPRWLRHDPPLPLRAAPAAGPGGAPVPAALATPDPGLLVAVALAGAGILVTLRPLVAAHLAAGRLMVVPPALVGAGAAGTGSAAGDAVPTVALQARLTPGEGAVARSALVLAAVAVAAGLPVPDAGQIRDARSSDVTAP